MEYIYTAKRLSAHILRSTQFINEYIEYFCTEMSLITRTDVTAVKFYKNLVLAGKFSGYNIWEKYLLHTALISIKLTHSLHFPGVGSSVNIYDKVSAKFLQRVCGLHGQKTYGFVPSQCGNLILLFGGKQFTVIASKSSEQGNGGKGEFYRLFEPVICDDWLHSAVWDDDEVVALLTAHNVVQVRFHYYLVLFI